MFEVIIKMPNKEYLHHTCNTQKDSIEYADNFIETFFKEHKFFSTNYSNWFYYKNNRYIIASKSFGWTYTSYELPINACITIHKIFN